MNQRIVQHCISCDTTGVLFGTMCVCPCHTWKYRICPCGKVRALVEFTLSFKVFGETKLDVIRAICSIGCHKHWPHDVEWTNCCEKTMDQWEGANPGTGPPESLFCQGCGVTWELHEVEKGPIYKVMI